MTRFFFFKAEDGIRVLTVTGVQTCALPILSRPSPRRVGRARGRNGGDRRDPQVAHPLQLEVPRRELLRKPLSRREPPLGGHGRPWTGRKGAPRHAGAEPSPVALRLRPPPRP